MAILNYTWREARAWLAAIARAEQAADRRLAFVIALASRGEVDALKEFVRG